jgi:hypothetical protein
LPSQKTLRGGINGLRYLNSRKKFFIVLDLGSSEAGIRRLVRPLDFKGLKYPLMFTRVSNVVLPNILTFM